MLDSPVVAAFVRSALLPAFVATVLMFLFSIIKDPWRARLQALTIALCFMAGAYYLVGRLHIPPGDAGEAFSWMALILAGFVFISPRPLGARYLVRGLFTLGLMVLVLWPLHQTITSPVYHRNLIAFFCLGLGVWSIVEKSLGKVKPTTSILLPMISATALSMLLLFGASASYSQLAAIACALFGGMLVLSVVVPGRLSLGALLPFLSVFVIMMMMAGHFYLDINPWHMIYLCWPFMVLWVREWLGFVPKKTLPEALILGAVSAAPLAYFTYTVAVKAGPLY